MKYAAQRLSLKLRDDPAAFPTLERNVLVERLATAMERRIEEADATGLSRLAWLCLRLNDEKRAAGHVSRGLLLEPDNEFCRALSDRLDL